MNHEPLVTTATITAAVTAVIGLLVAFGIPLTDEQQTAILAVVSVLAPLIVAAVARGKVTPASAVVAQETPDGVVVAGKASPVPTGLAVDVTASDPTYR